MSHIPQGVTGTCTACTHNDRSVVILCPLHKAAPALVAACEGLLDALAAMNAINHPELRQDVAAASAALALAKGE